MTSRWPRVLRGTTTAVAAVLAAAFSHVAAGGPAPGLLGTVLALVLGVPTCVALAGRVLTTPRLVLGVGVSQLALHVLFGVGAARGGTTTVGVTPAVAGEASSTVTGHVHGALVLHVAGPGGELVGVDAAGAGMTLGHALAAVLTVLVVRRGEAALVRLAGLARGLVTAVHLLTWRPRPAGPRLLPPPRPVVAPAAASLLLALPRRGPPRPA